MGYNSYLKVMAKDGGAGIDKQRIEMFNENLSGNLYKIWNRMTSGSYFPTPVRTVFIPKKQGGIRPLGIPTVSDRIDQGVVKDYLKPSLKLFFTQVPSDTDLAEMHMMHLVNAGIIVTNMHG